MRRKLMILTSSRNAKLLSGFAVVCTLFVSLAYTLTKPVIEQNKQLALLNNISQVLPSTMYDNDLVNSCIVVSDSALTGKAEPMNVYLATLNDQPSAIVFPTETTKGYNGLIQLLIAIDNKGVVQGVRTLSHQETPGLGDKIEVKKSDWILSFSNTQLVSPDDNRWKVKKDGGMFDQFTGATITPRAVVKQVKNAVVHAKQHFDLIFQTNNTCNNKG